MFNINHIDAIELEHIVSALYDCDRYGIAGLADASIFESNPLYAAILTISYFFAQGKSVNEKKLNEFWNKYQVIFDYSDEIDAKGQVATYIADLKEIIKEYKQ